MKITDMINVPMDESLMSYSGDLGASLRGADLAGIGF